MSFFLHQPWKNGKTPRSSCVTFGLRNWVKIVAGVCKGSIRGLSGVYQESVCQVSVRCLSGVCQRSVSGLLGLCQGSLRGLSGSVYQVSVRVCLSGVSLSGVCLSVICQVSVRGLSGVCKAEITGWVLCFLGSKNYIPGSHLYHRGQEKLQSPSRKLSGGSEWNLAMRGPGSLGAGTKTYNVALSEDAWRHLKTPHG